MLNISVRAVGRGARPSGARARAESARTSRARVGRARASTSSTSATSDGERVNAYDDGRPLIDVSEARARRARERRRESGVTRPDIVKSRAKALADADAASGRRAEDEDGECDAEERRAVRGRLVREDVGTGTLARMVRATDEMLDEMEAREAPAAVAAWELSKRAEAVAANPAVKGTVEVVGKVGGAALRAAAPVVLDSAGKVVKEGGKLAVRAAMSAAAAKVGFEDEQKRAEREKERKRALEERQKSERASMPSIAPLASAFGTLQKKASPEPPKSKGGFTFPAISLSKPKPPPEPENTGFPFIKKLNFGGGDDKSANNKKDKKRGGGGGFFSS